MIEILQAIFLGVIEGLTEFLPISSTGHLLIAQELIGFEDAEEIFTVVVQFGAIAAVLWYFRRDLWARVTGLLRREPSALAFWKLLIIATIPAGLAGLALDTTMEQITSPVVVALALIIGGVILWAVERRRAVPPKAEIQLDKISLRQGLIVGLSQCVALIPGVSRSGTTIVGGMQAGLNRPTATAFTFYLSIPIMVLASCYKLVQHADQISNISGGLPALAVGVVSAFFTALLAVSWLLKYISRHSFTSFAYYRIAAGVIILLLFAR
ncbi:undecaprenyl-diphosphatase [Candidatus Saccharibacteria bacterium]|nr:MAG: undecaprenyl-diphosphatase [Candidatus Saccharibacteria bacterium]